MRALVRLGIIPLGIAAILVPAAGRPSTAAEPADRPLLTLLPGGEALVAERVTLPAQAQEGVVPLERADGLIVETLRAIARETGETIAVAFTPPAGGIGPWLLDCLDREVRILPAGPAGRAGDLPEAGVVVAAGDPALVRFETLGVVPVAAERIACPGSADGKFHLDLILPRSVSGGIVDLSYRAAGWSWQARHRLDLAAEPGTARLAAVAVLTVPPGATFRSARLRLAEGDVPRRGRMEYAQDAFAEKSVRAAATAAPDAGQVTESTTYDLMLFDVPGTWNLRGPGQLSLPLRPARDVEVADVAVLELFRSPYAPGEEQPLVPRRHLRFTPGKDVALPGGVIEVGARRADGTWAPLGEVPTPRVPAGREADVALGALPDVVVFYRRPELNVLPQGTFQREAVVQFELENRRKQQTRFELRHELGSPYELLETDPEPARKEGSALYYALDLEPEQKAAIRFKLRFDPRPVRQ